MAEYLSFLNRLRQDLGKSYTVAEEHCADPRQVNIVVRRRRSDETLTVVTDTRWLALLTQEDAARAWDDYRSLTALVAAFFANPFALPTRSFAWPESLADRAALRQTLRRRVR